jgi:hypothetical protein
VDFIEEVSTRKWSACPTATATLQDLEWELVAKYSVDGSVFEFVLVDGQAETLVPKEAVVRSLLLSSSQLTVQKVKQSVNEGMQPMKFSMLQRGPDALIRKVPVSVTVCETGSGPEVEPLRLTSFEKIHDIGEGTFGILYAARDSRARRLVAVKLLKREVLTEEAVTLFQREVAILSSVDHETLWACMDISP